eukprot:3036625-Rhodomonas_salina.2
MGDSLPPSSVRPSSPRPALPNQLSGWAALAEQAGFQNWEQCPQLWTHCLHTWGPEQVFSGFVQDSPSGAQELFNFLQKKSKEMAEKKEENSASVVFGPPSDSLAMRPALTQAVPFAQKEPHADGDAGQSQRAHARDSSESHAQAGSETAKQRRINIGSMHPIVLRIRDAFNTDMASAAARRDQRKGRVDDIQRVEAALCEASCLSMLPATWCPDLT